MPYVSKSWSSVGIKGGYRGCFFNILRSSISIDCNLEPVSEYVKETYVIGRPGRGRRRAVPPRYPVPIWNQYAGTIEGQHRTNNCSEGWHNKFRLMVGKHHPDIYSFIRNIQREQSDIEIAVVELSLGRAVKAASKK